MSDQLLGKRIAFLTANEGVEQVELTGLRRFETGKPVGVICHGLAWTPPRVDTHLT